MSATFMSPSRRFAKFDESYGAAARPVARVFSSLVHVERTAASGVALNELGLAPFPASGGAAAPPQLL